MQILNRKKNRNSEESSTNAKQRHFWMTLASNEPNTVVKKAQVTDLFTGSIRWHL